MKALLVAPYPRTRGAHGEESLGGVASYTKNLAQALTKHADVRVLAPSAGPAGHRTDGAVAVRDVPQCESGALARALRREADAVDVVHVQFEQHLFGGPARNLHLAATLRRLRRRVRIAITVHQVPDLDAVDARFLKENGFPPFPAAAKAWMRAQYRALAAACHRVIVHEQVLADRLRDQYGLPPDQIRVVRHGVEARDPALPQADAKARLGASDRAVVLYFGYVTGYKGVDLLVEALEDAPPHLLDRMHVVIAGKAPDRKLAKPAFRASIDDLERRIRALAPHVAREGFLTEDEMDLHLAAADVVVFPYRHLFAASGPMSLTVAAGKPFLASDAFRGVLPTDEGLFERHGAALLRTLDHFLTDPDYRKRLEAASADLCRECAWPHVAERTLHAYGGSTR